MQHVKLSTMATMAISSDERAFFVQLGAHVAELRKAQNITQIQMAEVLGVSQQTINSYEVARRRIPVSTLPTLAKLFGVSIDELLGETDQPINTKRGPASRLQQQIEQIRQLPRSQQSFVSKMLDTVIQQAS